MLSIGLTVLLTIGAVMAMEKSDDDGLRKKIIKIFSEYSKNFSADLPLNTIVDKFSDAVMDGCVLNIVPTSDYHIVNNDEFVLMCTASSKVKEYQDFAKYFSGAPKSGKFSHKLDEKLFGSINESQIVIATTVSKDELKAKFNR